ncbi:MAG: GNAT family N-acetyltransferase [Chloroflexota bacterium]
MTDRPLADPSAASSEVIFRRPSEADYLAIVRVVDDWWGGDRRMDGLLPRLWLQHFTGTSWIVESDGRLVGFLIGFVSPDHADEAYVHMVASHPSRRGQGIGRDLYERFFADMRERGVRRVKAITWPGNRRSVGFHRAIGFTVEDGPGTQNLYGIPAYADYDFGREDRVVLVRSI